MSINRIYVKCNFLLSYTFQAVMGKAHQSLTSLTVTKWLTCHQYCQSTKYTFREGPRCKIPNKNNLLSLTLLINVLVCTSHLHHKVDVSLVLITGDWSVGPDHQSALHLGWEVHVLTWGVKGGIRTEHVPMWLNVWTTFSQAKLNEEVQQDQQQTGQRTQQQQQPLYSSSYFSFISFWYFNFDTWIHTSEGRLVITWAARTFFLNWTKLL